MIEEEAVREGRKQQLDVKSWDGSIFGNMTHSAVAQRSMPPSRTYALFSHDASKLYGQLPRSFLVLTK